MTIPAFHPRFILPRLTEALEDTPVVLIHGPRQCGKTTLARAVGDSAGYAYISFDSDVLRASAQTDPVGFIADLPDRTVLDEVQRVPELFTALKAAVDRDRRPGQFILTGSANVLLVPRLADSLAGRMEILRLHPLAQTELAEKEPAFLGDLFGEGFKTNQQARLGKELAEKIAAGGYPAALARSSPRRLFASPPAARPRCRSGCRTDWRPCPPVAPSAASCATAGISSVSSQHSGSYPASA